LQKGIVDGSRLNWLPLLPRLSSVELGVPYIADLH